MAEEMSRQLVRYCRYPAPLDLLLVAVQGEEEGEEGEKQLIMKIRKGSIRGEDEI